MKWWAWSIIGVGSAGVLGLSLWARKKAGTVITAKDDDRAGKDGIVPGDPTKLATAAGVPVDVYSLARCMQSEESTTAGRTGVGWATRNEAAREKISVTKLLLRSTKKDKATGKVMTMPGDGHYGSQELHKWAATTLAPTADTLALAAKILANPPQVSDPTGGATGWDAPATQDALHKKNPEKYKSSEEIAAKRQAAGKKLVYIQGVGRTRFWV